MNNTSVDSYLREGCGRCERFQTPECKVLLWTKPLEALRKLVLSVGLQEEMKWGSPCYTLDGKNVVALASLNDFCSLSFFKGALLEDEEKLLVAPGPNSRHARYLKFTSLKEVTRRREATLRLLEEAIAVQKAGKKVPPRSGEEPLPEELAAHLASDAELEAAFAQLTPGRRRSHALYVSGAKQSKTRVVRAQRCAAKILAGKGWNER